MAKNGKNWSKIGWVLEGSGVGNHRETLKYLYKGLQNNFEPKRTNIMVVIAKSNLRVSIIMEKWPKWAKLANIGKNNQKYQ